MIFLYIFIALLGYFIASVVIQIYIHRFLEKEISIKDEIKKAIPALDKTGVKEWVEPKDESEIAFKNVLDNLNDR